MGIRHLFYRPCSNLNVSFMFKFRLCSLGLKKKNTPKVMYVPLSLSMYHSRWYLICLTIGSVRALINLFKVTPDFFHFKVIFHLKIFKHLLEDTLRLYKYLVSFYTFKNPFLDLTCKTVITVTLLNEDLIFPFINRKSLFLNNKIYHT